MTVVYATCILSGFLLSLIIQNVDYNRAVSFMEWLKCTVFNLTLDGSKQLQLIPPYVTIFDHKSKPSSVAVLPSREVQEAGKIVMLCYVKIMIRLCGPLIVKLIKVEGIVILDSPERGVVIYT